MHNLAKQKNADDVKAVDLVLALKKHGLNLGIQIAHEVIMDMHEMAKERRLNRPRCAPRL